MAAVGDMVELAFAGPARQAELVAAREVSPAELVELCLERIERLDPQLHAFRVVLAERAREEARAIEGRPAAGRPLHGVPVAVKDDQDVEGVPTAYGTALVRPPAARDAEIVRRLREAGAIVIGKTNVPELVQWPFAESAAWGMSRNPWSPERTTGGSSGGSAAAVASGMVPLATGSDGLGSIRIPAACCGLFGLKPQRGRVSIVPREAAWRGLTHFGVLTRSVPDTALALDAIADRAPSEPFAAAAARAPGRLRIALSFKVPPPLMAPLDARVRAAVSGVADTLRGLGHEVVERDPPYRPAMLARGLSRYFRGVLDDVRELGPRSGFERRTLAMARIGALIPQAACIASQAEDGAHAAAIGELFEEVDVLLTPITARPPISVGRFEGRGAIATFNGAGRFVPFPGVWNMTGQPACSVPAGFTDDGVPLAAQLVGRPDDEVTLLSVAAQLEAERRWTDRRPPIS